VAKLPDAADFTPDELAAGRALQEHLRARRLLLETTQTAPHHWWADILTFVKRTRENRQAATHRLPPLEPGVVIDPWLDRDIA